MKDFVFYHGPSVLNGAPVIGVVTGLETKSLNPKTGAMAQAWIIRPDVGPMDAKRQNLDDAVCGDCKLRGDKGRDSVCYVPTWFGPNNIYKAFHRGRYPSLTPKEAAWALRGGFVRLGAYGDPAAIPFEVWERMLFHVDGWIGYTHQWKTCDRRFKKILMASVDTQEEWSLAWGSGWRTFRIRAAKDPVIKGFEFACPASDEMGHRTTCQKCLLCRGTSSPARNVAIVVHGHDTSRMAFYRRRPDTPRPVHHGRGRPVGSRNRAEK